MSSADWPPGPSGPPRRPGSRHRHCWSAEPNPAWFRENVAILADRLPDVRTETLPELDHLAPLSHPGELASTIGEFVSHTAPTPS
jgi:hypothetical protein